MTEENTILETKRVCSNCGSDKTRIKNGRYELWHKNDSNSWLCNKCYEVKYYREVYAPKKLKQVKEYYENNAEKIKSYNRRLHHVNREAAIVRLRLYQKIKGGSRNAIISAICRHALLELLCGGNIMCVYCGYNTDSRALQIDHIDGGGNFERKQFRNGLEFYKYYLERPEEAFTKLQVLCANCNKIKVHENEEYYASYL